MNFLIRISDSEKIETSYKDTADFEAVQRRGEIPVVIPTDIRCCEKVFFFSIFVTQR